MRPGSVLISILSLGIAFVGVIWLGRADVEVKPIPYTPPPSNVDISKLPKPAASGPYPFAVVDKPDHNFGLMQHGEHGSHEYEFTNTGEAPLQIAVGSSTCECTVGDKGIKTIAPGESAKVKLEWDIRNPAPHFQHSAEIHTNDPKNEKITLSIKGLVGRDFVRIPDAEWALGSFSLDEKAVVNGKVFSDTKDFEITNAVINNDLLKVEFARLNDVEMEAIMDERRTQIQDADEVPTRPKGAWRITISADGKTPIPLGEVKATVTFNTTLESFKTSTFEVAGRKVGPIKVVPIPKSGLQYYAAQQMVDIGGFAAKDGYEFKMMLLVSAALEEELKIEWTADPNWLHMEMKPGVVNENSSRYELTIRIPPGSPAMVKTTTNPAKILLKTNIPNVDELPISIAFVSQ